MARRRPLLRSRQRIESRHVGFRPPVDAEYVRDWIQLASGEQVLMVENDMPGISGCVDTVTEDGQILWLHLSNGGGRRLFIRLDDTVAWRVQRST